MPEIPPNQENSFDIAIVGMACKVPGAASLEEYWDLLRSGRSGIGRLSEQALRESGVPAEQIAHHDYVPVRGVLPDVAQFDAEFFGMSPREAALTDPQQRHFLECAWSALEDAGYDPRAVPGNTGVFAGSGWNSYLLMQLAARPDMLAGDAGHQTLLGNEKDNLTTRVSYKLNLTGPSVAVQTGCSSSLVAISQACQSLLERQSDVVVSGGVSITVPQGGYVYRQGGILSRNGQCRAFDAQADGTVLGNGVGVVVLKRLDDALADGDHVYAVIKATAINNDGARKAGFTAPSIEGQASCIAECHALADITPDTISYVEAHGTGTEVGDPIEVAALTKAFGPTPDGTTPCLLGSVKTNIGHLDAAAGVMGLIKVALMLHHKELVPSLNFDTLNPHIDVGGRFQVSQRHAPWQRGTAPRRAGVSSFGLGGTNAHALLEEAPAVAGRTSTACGPQLLVLSARSMVALRAMMGRLAAHLRAWPDTNLADVAWTLSQGRTAFPYRCYVVAKDVADAVEQLDRDSQDMQATPVSATPAKAALLFPGQGSQYVGMAHHLYRADAVFRAHLDEYLSTLENRYDLPLRELLCSDAAPTAQQQEALTSTAWAQPALFIVCLAQARMWMHYGMPVQALIGHSIGELVAATLAGVFSPADALALVVERGRLMQAQPAGAMLAIALSAAQLATCLPDALDIAAANEANSCVVAGRIEDIAAFEAELTQQGVTCRRLHTSHAFHSRAMDPALAPFARLLETMSLSPPTIPFVSNVTGQWITDEEATNPQYWARHLRAPVLFHEGLETLLQQSPTILLEAGPGRTLSQFAKRHHAGPGHQAVVAGTCADVASATGALDQLGQLWVAGIDVRWSAVQGATARRVPLPGYPFERKRHWIEATTTPGTTTVADTIWQVLLDSVQSHAASVLSTFDRASHATRKRALDVLCVGYINRAMQEMGLFADDAQAAPAERLVSMAGVSPQFRQLFIHMLGTLARHQQLRDSGGAYSELRRCTAETLAQVLDHARQAWAGEEEVVDLAAACGDALVAVLRGTQAPLELFSSVLAQVRAPVQAGASLHDSYNAILRVGMEAVLRHLPRTAPVRILEIGGGTGVATTALLPVLPPERTQYRFTDIGGYFVSKAREKFGSYPFVDFSTFNVDLPPEQQGLNPHQYDIVIAVNMLHATRHIDTSLRHARKMLAPGGLLLIWEITRAAPDFDLTYGLLMDEVDDGNRNQGDPFLDGAGWSEALQANGFARVAVLPDDEFFEEQVIVAQADDTSAGTLFAAPPLPACVASRTAVPITTLLDKKADITDWFHEVSWRRKSIPAAVSATRRWLIFSEGVHVGEALAALARDSGDTTVVVTRGDAYARIGARNFTVRPNEREDFDHLAKALRSDDLVPDGIAFLWGLGRTAMVANADPAVLATLGQFDGLLWLVQSIGAHWQPDPLTLTVVTDGLHALTGLEAHNPDQALLLGLTRVVGLEYPHIACRAVDVELNDGAGRDLTARLLTEMRSDSADTDVVALRREHRWVRSLEPMRLAGRPGLPKRLRQRGVYLISGGLGKIGLTIAEDLVRTCAARVVLVGRSALPPPSEWQRIVDAEGTIDGRGQVLSRLLALQEAGGEVLVCSADVADLTGMEVAVHKAIERFGTIHGVIHAAGMLGDSAIQDKTLAQVNAVLRAKVIGTKVLDELFRQRELDFFMLFSSLSALKPGFGQLAYCAANNFVDAYAQSRPRNNTICVSWDVWKGDGMAYDAAAPALIEHIKQADFQRRGLTSEEGIEVFRRALWADHPHLLVCTSGYLHADSRDMAEIYAGHAQALTRPTMPAVVPRVDVVAPATGIERTLSQLWSELLGIPDISVDSDFFELGGDSLIGTLMVSRILARLGVRLPTRTIYECRTIRALAAAVEEALIASVSPEELDLAMRAMQTP